MRTRQEIFNLAWNGLKAQGFVASYTPEEGCVYRGPKGLRCAVGHCIPDEKYSAEFEGRTPLDSKDIRAAASIDARERHFARKLQVAHDDSEGPISMEQRLRSFAADHSLTIPA